MESNQLHKDPQDSIERVLQEHLDDLMKYPNVTGVGIQQEYLPDGSVLEFIQVYVANEPSDENLERDSVIPRILQGFDVRVQNIGAINIE
jgi:hypothetical protein